MMGILDAPGISRNQADARYFKLNAPTIVLFGDSRTADCSYSDATNSYATNLSWFELGQVLNATGPVFEVIKNAGIGGNTTQQMLDRMQVDVIAYAPDKMTLFGGTNDNWVTQADVDATFARMVQMMQMAKAAGIYVFLISETTVSTAKAATFNPMCLYYNELLRNYAATNQGVEYWDFCNAIINPVNANGGPLSTMVRDGIHLSALGAFTLAKNVVAKKLARFGTALVSLSNSLIDSRGNNNFSRNVLSNPLFNTATGGTLGGGHTGTLPSSITSSGSAGATFSVPARSDGFGNDMQAVITAASSSDTLNLAASVSTSRLVPGSKYVIEMALEISAPTNLFSIPIKAQIFNGGTVYTFGTFIPVQSAANGDSLPATGPMIVRTPVFTLPTGFTYSSAAFVLGATFGGAGGATIKWGRISYKMVR